MSWSRLLPLLLLVGLVQLYPFPALAQRPQDEDLAACDEFARNEAQLPAYVERAPLNPFPERVSKVAPWTGPITGLRPPARLERAPRAGSVETPATSGLFGAGGASQEATSEQGRVPSRYREAFEACLRVRGY